jgi:hypothetical protein
MQKLSGKFRIFTSIFVKKIVVQTKINFRENPIRKIFVSTLVRIDHYFPIYFLSHRYSYT